MSWEDQIQGCFGSEDKVFAGHNEDRERAKVMIEAAASAGASRREVRARLRKFLVERSCPNGHVRAQIREFHKLLRSKDSKGNPIDPWVIHEREMILIGSAVLALCFVVVCVGILAQHSPALAAIAVGIWTALVAMGTKIRPDLNDQTLGGTTSKLVRQPFLWGRGSWHRTIVLVTVLAVAAALTYAIGPGSLHQFYFQCADKLTLTWDPVLGDAPALDCSEPTARQARIWTPWGSESMTKTFRCRDANGALGPPVRGADEFEWRCRTRNDASPRDAGRPDVITAADGSVDVPRVDAPPASPPTPGPIARDACEIGWVEWVRSNNTEGLVLRICLDRSHPVYRIHRRSGTGVAAREVIVEQGVYSHDGYQRSFLMRYPDGVGQTYCNPILVAPSGFSVDRRESVRCDGLLRELGETRMSVEAPLDISGNYMSRTR